MTQTPKGLRTWIEIDTKALAHNYRVFRKLIGKKCRLMAVAKSNAYGHSLVDFARLMQRIGADWIGVDSIVEAITLREAHVKKPILILGHTLPERYGDVFRTNARVTISNFEALEVAIHKASPARRLTIHVKVDTGMSRQGFFIEDLPRACELLDKYRSRIIFEGLYTHFAAAKNPAFPRDTEIQIQKFEQAAAIVEGFGFTPIKHAAASSGTIVFPKSHYDMVRIGIGMYGLWPSKEVEAAFGEHIHLRPALTWKTIIGEIKMLKKGDRVGYDFTERIFVPTRVAICPVGYWHGYPRALSSIGHFIVKSRRARVLGRVSMDMTAIDISGVADAKIGDVAIILGDGISADDHAFLSDTSNYEVITRINPLIKRIYL